MGFHLKKWLLEKIGGNEKKISSIDIGSGELSKLIDTVYVRELAFWTCVGKVANAISKCEFKTYIDHKSVKRGEYYLWNWEPNKNQNTSAFLQKLIGNLYRCNEALVVESNGQMLVADSFCKSTYALYNYQFTNVCVDEFTFGKTFYQEDVLYWQLNSEDMRRLTNGIYESYQDMIAYAMKSFNKSRGSRGILNVEEIASGKENFQETFEKLMNERFRNFFHNENAVLPLFEGYSYEDIGSKTYSNEGTRDIKALIDDVFDYTARAFSIPPSLAKGDVQDTSKATDELLTFCIDPLVKMLEQEINRKRNGLKGFLNGNYLKIDTTAVKHIDLFDIATPVDKLISSGAFCINDIRKIIGEETIEEEWAYQHFITKNYATVQDLLKQLDNGG